MSTNQCATNKLCADTPIRQNRKQFSLAARNRAVCLVPSKCRALSESSWISIAVFTLRNPNTSLIIIIMSSTFTRTSTHIASILGYLRTSNGLGIIVSPSIAHFGLWSAFGSNRIACIGSSKPKRNRLIDPSIMNSNCAHASSWTIVIIEGE